MKILQMLIKIIFFTISITFQLKVSTKKSLTAPVFVIKTSNADPTFGARIFSSFKILILRKTEYKKVYIYFMSFQLESQKIKHRFIKPLGYCRFSKFGV